MQTIAITGTPRQETGKKATKMDRKSGGLPCVIYGAGEPVHFTTSASAVRHLVFSPDVKLANIELGGKTISCILKDIQFHPVDERIMHIDFMELGKGRKVKLTVPVRFVGTSPGVKAGGKLIQRMRKVTIKTTPEAIIDEVSLDISSMELGSSLRVRDVKVSKEVEIMNNPSIPLASIEIPRALKSAATAETKAAGKK